MIKNKTIKVKVNNSTLKHYNKKYNCKPKDIIVIDVDDLPEQSTQIIDVICDICGKEKSIQYRKYINNKSNKGFYTCSLSCSQEKIKLTKMENHGDPNFCNLDKRKKTCKEKYNDENYKNIEKQKETNLERYGFEHVIMNKDIQEKRKRTWIENYGEEHPMKNNKTIDKKRETSKQLYDNENFNNIEKTLRTIKNKNIEKLKNKFNLDVIDYKDGLFFIKCEKGHTYKSDYNLIYIRNKYNSIFCTICNPIGVQYSDSEKQILDFIKESYNGEIIENNRNIINPYELDIYLPDLKLAFEYNGLYWHSELYRNKNYHKMKYESCKEKNIQLIQFFDDDWNLSKDIVKSMILNKLNKTPNKIYARNCQINEIKDNELVRNFLIENHIQGYVKSTIKLGLFHNSELVSLMTFIKNGENYELNRFCSKIYHNIIGSSSKLFKYFINNFKYNNIISFSNNLYSNGDVYFKLNFKKIKDLKEDYSYIKNNKRVHKFNFRKQNQLTERENNLKKGLLRIYDAGKIKFIYS